MKAVETSRQRPGPARFRAFLQAELARRCAANPHYSLRSFARQLDVDHSTLSQILRGKRSLTPRTIESLAAALKLDAAATEAWMRLEESVPESPAAIGEMKRLTRDAASLITDWHHFAILELVRLDDFRPDTRWIARVLSITPDEVNLALSRLLHLDLLRMTESGRWVDMTGNVTADAADFTRATLDRLADQTRKLTAEDRAGGPEFLEKSVMTMAVDSARVPAAIEMLARFRREFVAFLEASPRRDQVVRLDVDFYPLTFMNREEARGTTGDSMADPVEGT